MSDMATASETDLHENTGCDHTYPCLNGLSEKDSPGLGQTAFHPPGRAPYLGLVVGREDDRRSDFPAAILGENLPEDAVAYLQGVCDSLH